MASSKAHMLLCLILLVASSPTFSGGIVIDRDRESIRLPTGPQPTVQTPRSPAPGSSPSPPRPVTSLTIEHLAGSVTLVGSTEAAVQITMVREGRGEGSAAARAHRDRLRMDSRIDHGHSIVRTLCWGGHSGAPFHPGTRGALEGLLAPLDAAPYVRRGEPPPLAHLTVTTPTSVSVTVHTVFGTVLMKGTKGEVAVKTTTGLVDVDSCEGRVRIETDSGPVFLRGETDLKGRIITRSGSVRARDFKGQLDVETGSGPIDVSYRDPGRGDQHFYTSSGSVSVRVPRTARLSVDVHGPRRLLLQGLPLIRVHQGENRLTGLLQERLGSLDIRTKTGTVRLEPR